MKQCDKCPYWLPRDIERCPLCPHDGSHEMSLVAIGHSDQAVCSCGWSSATYWDGAEYAEDEWKKHAAQGIEAGTGETEGLDGEAAKARSEGCAQYPPDTGSIQYTQESRDDRGR